MIAFVKSGILEFPGLWILDFDTVIHVYPLSYSYKYAGINIYFTVKTRIEIWQTSKNLHYTLKQIVYARKGQGKDSIATIRMQYKIEPLR